MFYVLAVFSQGSHRVFMGFSLPLFIGNDTLPLQVVFKPHIMAVIVVLFLIVVVRVMREWKNLLQKY